MMAPGEILFGCELVRRIGRGSFGEVWEAVNARAGRRVALKIVERLSEEPAEQEHKRAAEKRGAEIQKRAAEIDPRVVEVFDYGFETRSGAFGIEMELVEGRNLGAWVENNRLATETVAHIGAELCEMLEHLTPTGIVHGDIKPANVLLRPDGSVKVADFGIAKELSPARAYTENPYATTLYSSPERVDTGKVDIRSDIWSVGVILYQLIALRLPFTGDTRREVENRICGWEPPGPLPDDCPESLARIVFKMLARRPESRYADARENKQDLHRFLRGEPVAAAAEPPDDSTIRTRPMEDSETDADATVRTGAPPPAPEPPVRPHRHRVARWAFYAFAAMLAIAGWMVYSEYRVWVRAGEFRDALGRGAYPGADEAWTVYKGIQKDARLSLTTWLARRSLESQLERDADRIIGEYRNEIPTVTKADWQKAERLLTHALELDPGDRKLSGRLRLVEGHIRRIDSQNKRLTRAQHDRMVNEAASLFQEAAGQIHHWPDPYLGLLRLYTYESANPEMAEQALNKAHEYGHPVRNRERAQLADAYSERARTIWKESRQLTDLPQQEKQYLEKARRDCTAATEHYQAATTYGNAVASLRGTLELCSEIGYRLDELIPMTSPSAQSQ
jgi:hypothetical protein